MEKGVYEYDNIIYFQDYRIRLASVSTTGLPLLPVPFLGSSVPLISRQCGCVDASSNFRILQTVCHRF